MFCRVSLFDDDGRRAGRHVFNGGRSLNVDLVFLATGDDKGDAHNTQKQKRSQDLFHYSTFQESPQPDQIPGRGTLVSEVT